MIPLINDFNSSHISFVSDDRDVIDLKENGHTDYLIRTTISFGVHPIRAIQMATINTARYFGLKNIGAIAPGFKADFILLDLYYNILNRFYKLLTIEHNRIIKIFINVLNKEYINCISNRATKHC